MVKVLAKPGGLCTNTNSNDEISDNASDVKIFIA